MGVLDGRDRHWCVKRDRSRHHGSIMKVGRGTIRATCPNSEILPERTDEVFYGLPRKSTYPIRVSEVSDKPACVEQSNKLWGMACSTSASSSVFDHFR